VTAQFTIDWDPRHLQRLAALGGAAISHMGPIHALPPLLPLTTAARTCVGPAWPVTIAAADISGLAHALHEAPTGCVVVLAIEPAIDMAVLGGLSALDAVRARVAGVVVDGYVCDLGEIEEAGLAVYARGLVAKASPLGSLEGGYRPQAVVCGVAVQPDDLVVGTLDGVVIVPAATARAALDGESALRQREARIKAQLQEGQTLWSLICDMRDQRRRDQAADAGSARTEESR
jgi:regulator of RNase E activity RraA